MCCRPGHGAALAAPRDSNRTHRDRAVPQLVLKRLIRQRASERAWPAGSHGAARRIIPLAGCAS